MQVSPFFIQQHLSSQQYIEIHCSFLLLKALLCDHLWIGLRIGLKDHSFWFALQLLLKHSFFQSCVISARQKFVIGSWLMMCQNKLLLIVPGLVVLILLMPGSSLFLLLHLHSGRCLLLLFPVTIALMFVWKYTADTVKKTQAKPASVLWQLIHCTYDSHRFIMWVLRRADSVCSPNCQHKRSTGGHLAIHVPVCGYGYRAIVSYIRLFFPSGKAYIWNRMLL